MTKTCARCGSDKIIPDVPMWDHIGDLGARVTQSRVEVPANPKAFLFRGNAFADLSLDICGNCGHAAVFVSDPEALWANYEKSKG
jgi:hypothetical protein